MLNLSHESLNWALNQAELLGESDIFPLPFEFLAIKHDWKEIKGFLRSENILKWQARPHRECLSPKSALGFRIATQLDPLDWLIYNALVYEIGTELERYRLPREDGSVYSWRFEPETNGTVFSRNFGYRQFQERASELASASDIEYVVVSDIADFFPNLYHHRIENALRSASQSKNGHTTAIMKLFSQWREKQSFGIPTGPSASRLIAEVTIHDVDEALKGHGLTFVRYADDYRIFCETKTDAYRSLATLAEVLWKSHGLTLSGLKTEILRKETFSEQFLRTGKDVELEHLSKSFEEIVDALELDDWYSDIDYDELDDEEKAMVDELNLEELLQQQLNRELVDVRLTRFILQRLAQLQDSDAAPLILSSVDKLYPVFKYVVDYLRRLKDIKRTDRIELGRNVLGLLDDSVVSHLEYHRLHLINLFTSSVNWGNEQQIAKLLNRYSDPFTRRELILAMGRSGQIFWFRQHKTDWHQFSAWERRAFIRGASSFESDERKYWYSSIENRLDPLEKAIVKWSKQNPIHP